MRGSRPALLGAAALLLLVVLAAQGESPVPSSTPAERRARDLPETTYTSPSVTVTPSPWEDRPLPASAPDDPGLVAWILIWAGGVLIVLAFVLSMRAWLRLRRRVGVGGLVGDADDDIANPVLRLRMRKAVEQARDLLAREGGEPGDAVIKAWVTLENATEHRREPHQTATEFSAVLVNDENAGDLRELRTLYQRARFGHRSSADDARQALAALDRILATIR